MYPPKNLLITYFDKYFSSSHSSPLLLYCDRQNSRHKDSTVLNSKLSMASKKASKCSLYIDLNHQIRSKSHP